MRTLTLITSLLALGVIVLWAYTRLSDAGLGCPDWPGCYGHWVVPSSENELSLAQTTFQQPVEANKAWTEMVHRYLAGSLGISVIAVAIFGFIRKFKQGKFPLTSSLLIALIIFQALLGMWTVTLLLKPVIVLLHLCGGLTILSLVWWQFLTTKRNRVRPQGNYHRYTPWAIMGLAILVMQIIFGGWTSTNYAALICPDFPFCQGRLLPGINLHGFFAGHDNTALISIHMMHRLGALITVTFLGILSISLIGFSEDRIARRLGLILFVLLATQLTFGVLNVTHYLPMPIAVGHNLVAALLLLTMISLTFRLTRNNTGIFNV